jgi:hypothetical protein
MAIDIIPQDYVPAPSGTNLTGLYYLFGQYGQLNVSGVRTFKIARICRAIWGFFGKSGMRISAAEHGRYSWWCRLARPRGILPGISCKEPAVSAISWCPWVCLFCRIPIPDTISVSFCIHRFRPATTGQQSALQAANPAPQASSTSPARPAAGQPIPLTYNLRGNRNAVAEPGTLRHPEQAKSLTVAELLSPNAALPPIGNVSFSAFPDGQGIAANIVVPDDQPPGTDSGVICDGTTHKPLGALTVQVMP